MLNQSVETYNCVRQWRQTVTSSNILLHCWLFLNHGTCSEIAFSPYQVRKHLRCDMLVDAFEISLNIYSTIEHSRAFWKGEIYSNIKAMTKNKVFHSYYLQKHFFYITAVLCVNVVVFLSKHPHLTHRFLVIRMSTVTSEL